MILRVAPRCFFLRKQCSVGIYEIGDLGTILCCLEVRVSPGTVRGLSTWKHFCCLGSIAFEISALGSPSSNVALPNRNPVSGVAERSHSPARKLDNHIVYPE